MLNDKDNDDLIEEDEDSKSEIIKVNNMDIYISLLDYLNDMSKTYVDTKYEVVSLIASYLCQLVKLEELEELENKVLPNLQEVLAKLLNDKYRE